MHKKGSLGGAENPLKIGVWDIPGSKRTTKESNLEPCFGQNETQTMRKNLCKSTWFGATLGQFHAYPKGPQNPSKIGFSAKLPLTNLKVNCHELITQSRHLAMKRIALDVVEGYFNVQLQGNAVMSQNATKQGFFGPTRVLKWEDLSPFFAHMRPLQEGMQRPQNKT